MHSAHLFQVDATLLAALHSATSLGTIVAGAAVIRSVGRHQPQRSEPKQSFARLSYSLAISSTAFAFCWLVLIVSAPVSIIFSAGLGTLITLFVVLIRRLFLGPLTGSAIGLAVVAMAVAIAVSGSSIDQRDPTLRFANGVPSASLSAAERMMIDNRFGTGAATYEILLPIYLSSGDRMASDLAPTTASTFTIEMSRAALWMFAIFGLILACRLFIGALRRGRDSFYASAAAGCVVALIAQSFLNASLLLTEIVVLATCVLGVGVSQSMSRSNR